HAYLNVMYMGEISICTILHDPMERIAALQAKTKPYTKALEDGIIGYFMFEASFSLIFADDNVDKDDVSYVVGHCFRAVSCLNQVLFAKNGKCRINEKKAVAMINDFPVKPENYKQKVKRVFGLLSMNQQETREGVELLRELIADTERIVQV